MNKLKKISLGLFFALALNSVIAQRDGLVKNIDTLLSKNITSLETDILPKVFSAAINNGIISTSGTSLKLNTTIFGLKKLFSKNSSDSARIMIDSNYMCETFNRNFAFGSGINIDANNKINGVQGYIKWAVINNRDVSLLDSIHTPGSLWKKEQALDDAINIMVNNLGKISDSLEAAKGHTFTYTGRSSVTTERTITDAEYKLLTVALTKFTNDKNVKNLYLAFAPFKSKINLDTSVFKRIAFIDSLATSIENDIRKRAIFTIGVETDYVNKSWDSIYFKAEYIKGLGWEKDSTKPWDFYVGGFYNLKMDTLAKKALQRQVFTVKVGLNKVFAKRADGGPLFEVLGAAQFDDVAKHYPGEKQYTLAADFTFTVKVSNSVSIPFEVKYDPTNKGNLFGFLKVKWDILTSKPKS